MTKISFRSKLSAVAFCLICARAALGGANKIPDQNPFRTSATEELKSEMKKSPSLKIYFSGNTSGARESCGCALNPKGGFERRFNFLKREGLQSSHPDDVIVVDFGNLLFKSEKLSRLEKKEAIPNAQKMVDGSNYFHYDAVNFGFLDRSVPIDDLKGILGKAKFPWLSSNIMAPGRMGATFRRRIPIKLKNASVVLLGLSSSSEDLASQGWKFEKPGEVLEKELADTPADVLPIVLSDLEATELMQIAAKIKRPTLFLGSREMGGWDRPIEVGQSLLVHIRHQGQDFGVFKVPAKWAGKTGWYNPVDSDNFASRWDDLVTESLTMRGLASSPQKDREAKILADKLTELSALAPNAAADIPFAFEAIEMGQSFDGANEVTPLTK